METSIFARIHRLDVPEIDVQAARQRLGMTQPAFAEPLRVPLSTLRKWETRVRRLRARIASCYKS
jgi:DNA-binding transcriptional regulator YiaG